MAIEIPNYNSEQSVKVDLVSSYSPKHGAAIGLSLGLEAIAGHLQGEYDDQVRVDHIDMQLDPDPETILQRVSDERPHILGIGYKIGAQDQVANLLERVHNLPIPAREKPLIVLGGVVPTFAPEELLRRHPNVILALKEGEVTADALVKVIRGEMRLDQVPGIAYLNADSSLHSTHNKRLPLNQLHHPAHITTKRIVDELGGMTWFEGSRGCDFHCTFCSRRELRGDGFSGDIPPEHVVDEMERLVNMGITSMSATDDDWGGDPERSMAIVEGLIARGVKANWSISTRADHIFDERHPERNARLREIMEMHKRAGLERVFLGMESGSPTQLKRYGKQVSVMGNYQAINILRELEIDAIAGYIPLDPLMNLTELKENLEFLRATGMHLKVSNPLSVLRVQDGSPYLQMMQQPKHRHLLGDRTEDIVFYYAQFADPKVQQIATIADQWVTDLYPLIFGLKGEVANITLGPGEQSPAVHAIQTLLYQFRELEMNFIEALTAASIEGQQDLTSIVNNYQLLRGQLVQLTHDQVENQGLFGHNGRLRDVIRDYCK